VSYDRRQADETIQWIVSNSERRELGRAAGRANMGSTGGDPNDQPDGSWYNLFPDSSQPGLIGGQFASQQAADGGMDWANPGPGSDNSGDGTGLPPSLSVAPYLPRQGGGGNTSEGSITPTPFNLYDMLHRGLNTPFGSDALQIAKTLSQGMEKYGPYAAQLGTAGAVGGAVTGNLPFATGSAGLAILGAAMDGLGHGLDAGTSFLQSVQQDNGQPLDDFKRRMETPGFYDLEFPESK
jgi:hypothetical protein